jgi:hypothetical protein
MLCLTPPGLVLLCSSFANVRYSLRVSLLCCYCSVSISHFVQGPFGDRRVNMLVRVVCDCGGKARGTHKSSVVPARSAFTPAVFRFVSNVVALWDTGCRDVFLRGVLAAHALATWCWGSEPWSLYGRKLYVRQSLQLGPGGVQPWRLLVSVLSASATVRCILWGG